MKNIALQKNRKLTRIACALIGILFLVGCQLSVEKRDRAPKDILHTLQSATDNNEFLNKKSALRLPDEIKSALTPRMQDSQGRNAPVIEKRFDLFAEQVPAKTFFLSLVEDTPFNITVHPGVEGKISLQLKKVTITEVLETVRNVYGYDFRQTAQGVEVLPATLQTRAFPVNYLDLNRGGESQTEVSAGTLKAGSGGGSSSSGTSSSGATSTGGAQNTSTTSSGGSSQTGVNSKVTTRSKTNFWEELQKTVEAIVGNEEGRHVAISPLASLIVVQAMPQELKKVEEFLKSAELSLNRQVILEAKIIEVELNDSFQAGINWSAISGRLKATQYNGDVIKSPVGLNSSFPLAGNSSKASPVQITPSPIGVSSNVESNIGAFGGVFALAVNYKNLGSFIELLGAQGKVHVLSSPRVSTINNQKALIKVGLDQFFITNVSTTTTTSTATQQTTPNVSFDSFFSGIALDVTPHISDNEEITLHIHPTISVVEDDVKNFTLNGQAQSYPLAKSSVRESDSMVKAKNGEMVIIGGLMQDQTSELKEGIPVLKDLPLLGNLFRHTVQTTKKSELVILLRPIIVENDTWADQLNQTSDHFQRLDDEVKKDERKYRCKGPNC